MVDVRIQSTATTRSRATPAPATPPPRLGPVVTAFDEDHKWHTRGPDDIASIRYRRFQQEPPGVERDGSVMIEQAPSGAYVEEWHRLPGSTERLITSG